MTPLNQCHGKYVCILMYVTRILVLKSLPRIKKIYFILTPKISYSVSVSMQLDVYYYTHV